MALVKCIECGQMVSDKAEACPNCGCPVEKATLAPVCAECGAELKATDIVCSQCGCPVETNEAEITSSTKATSAKNEYSEEKAAKVQQFLVKNKKFLPVERMEEIRSQLLALTDKQWTEVEWTTFKDPTTMLLISVFVGSFGIDRFMLGDTQNGVFKLVLTLCCGAGTIWWIYDLFKINEMTLMYNYKLLTDTIQYV